MTVETMAAFSGVSSKISGYISANTRKAIGTKKCQPDFITSLSVGAFASRTEPIPCLAASRST